MRRCLCCDGRFDEQRRLCPEDGEVLIDEGKPTADTGTIIGGRYRLGNLIGEGGMGRVFEAVPLDGGGLVAIKLLRPGFAGEKPEKRFRMEAEATAAVGHPGVAKVLECSRTEDGQAYIVMERLLGPTFEELRRAGKFASAANVVRLMREASEVMAAAHRKGIVHRDLKPTNIILHRVERGCWQTKILDFGIAKFLDRTESLTSTGEFMGTLIYMAPEQIDSRTVTPAADVYSLGVILFEALAGNPPFNARSPLELLRLQATSPAPSLSRFRPDVSDELEELVARCLSKKPENRCKDAGELAEALARVGAERPPDEQDRATKTLAINAAGWVGSVLDETYELHEWMAPGRFGSNVYLATHLRTGAPVAVRLWKTGRGAVRDALLDAFRKEARSMGIRHPNLIAVLDLGFNDECVYIVTEFVQSGSLRALIASRGALPPVPAVDLVQGAADALGALHQAGIVSGGLSPETVRVTGSHDRPEKLLIAPFGLTSLKQVETLLGTMVEGDLSDRSLDYIAPEQKAGGEPDPPSDLYSLGLILLEMLCGQIPEPLVPGAIPLPAAPSEEWNRFFLRAIARNPQERFPTAAEFSAAMAAIASLAA